MKEQRLVFGDHAELYDRVRSAYPAELVDDLVALVGVPCRALDIGCGTGKATVMLAERGVEGVGVEPDPAMARIARRHLAEHDGWRVDHADFEEWEPRPEDAPLDLITAATAWHWVDRDRGSLQAQRLLRPGGWLAIFGHRPTPPDTPLRRAIDALYERHAPHFSTGTRAAREPVAADAAFDGPIQRDYPAARDFTAEEWIALLQTSSDHILLAADRRELLLSDIQDAINEHGGVYRNHSICTLWAAQRL